MARGDAFTDEERRLIREIDLDNSDVERVWQDAGRIHVELSYPVPDCKDAATLPKNPL